MMSNSIAGIILLGLCLIFAGLWIWDGLKTYWWCEKCRRLSMRATGRRWHDQYDGLPMKQKQCKRCGYQKYL